MTAVKEALVPIYTILGAIAFWGIVAAVLLVGSVAAVEWWRGRQFVKDIDRVKRLTPEQTDRLIREWRQRV